MRVKIILLAASLTLPFASAVVAQGVPGGGGSGGNFQSEPDVNFSGSRGRDFDGPNTTGSVGRGAPADLGDAADDGDEDADDLDIAPQNRGRFDGSDVRAIQRR